MNSFLNNTGFMNGHPDPPLSWRYVIYSLYVIYIYIYSLYVIFINSLYNFLNI